ncbi:MAG TPA: transporter substrate-binding domain-containing protein [Acidimicrobiales bacterium]|nr:transporter substrate-binding domain-containing protein [Acidimicrobiales bacterium]
MRTLTTRLVATLAVGALALAACGDDDDSEAGDSADTTEADGGQAAADVELVNEGTLTVCSDTPYEPFEFEGPDGEQTGYDMDILRAIAENNDLSMEVIDLPFDGILGSLAAGDCDVVGSAVTITDERAEQVDFSDPYFDADQSLLVRAEDEDTYATLEDLAGQTIGVQSGTTGEAYANENTPQGATIQSFEDSDGLFGAIAAGQIAAILQDFPVNAFRATQDDSLVVTETFPTGEQYGFAVEKGNEGVLTLINDGLAELRDSGEFDEIFQQYFGEAES